MNKKSVLLIISALMFVGCAMEEDEIRKAVEEYQALNMNDFSSYEFVSLTLDSAMTQAHNINESKTLYQKNLEQYKPMLKEVEADNRRFGGGFEDFIRRYQNQMEKDRKVVERLDSLLQGLGEQANSVACFVYNYSYRENNEFGARVLRVAKLYMTPELEVKTIALERGKELVTCNQLEATEEILEQY